MTTRELDRLIYLRDLLAMSAPDPFVPLPHQEPPAGDWYFWLLEAGRGAGKTTTAAHRLQEHLNGPPCISDDLPHRALLIAPTIGDGIESAALNDQALTRIEPGAELRQSKGGTRVVWPNRSQVRVVGTHTREDIERLRAAGNSCIVWAEELAAWRYLRQAWDIMSFGLRKGPHPRVIATTTPKARPEYKEVRALADHVSKATMLDNPNLNAAQRDRLVAMYEGTTIGRQELYGELIEEAEGAIWTSELVEEGRRPHLLTRPDGLDADEGWSPMSRVVVAVDPPGGATEAGIVTAATIPDCRCGSDGPQPHYAVVDDRSGKLSPDGWGSRAVSAFVDWSADKVVGESNFGGDMVRAIVKGIDATVPYKDVRASRGKRVRAEPIHALYEQGRVHHVGTFDALEAEMVQWIPDESDWSPNRLDALVWALSYLSGRMDGQWWSA